MSAEQITADIEQSIRENLPAQVGEVLRVRLDQTEVLENLRDELAGKLATRDEQLAALQEELAGFRAREAKAIELNDTLATREAAVTEREARMTELELRAELEQNRVRDHKEMVALIFRNPMTTKTINESVPLGAPGFYDKDGNFISQINGPTKETTTTEVSD